MKRPRIKVKKNNFDRLVELLTVVAVLAGFAFPAFYYPELPEQVPMHFNASGTPDRMGSRSSIWILPVLSAAMCLGISRLIKVPHLFNYPGRITVENAKRSYQMAQRSLRMINLIIAGSIAYITLQIIFSALGRAEGLDKGFIVLFSVLMLGTPLFFLLKMRRMFKE